MKKILFISAFPPSNYGAGVKYSERLVLDLKKYFSVDLYYFDYKDIKCNIDNSECKKNNLKLKLIRCILFPFFHPFFTAKFSFSLLFKLIRESKNYDLVYFDFSQVFIYSLFIRSKHKVLMSHDVIYQSYLRKGGTFNNLQLFFIKFSERLIFKYSNAEILVFSEKDQRLLKELYNIENVYIVDFYCPKEIEFVKPNYINNFFVFFAGWSRPENYESLNWFLENVISLVSPYHKFKIIGPHLPNFLINKIRNYNNFEYIGFIENPYIIISEAKALIAPIFKGAGVKVKCLEAIQCGIPIIGTKIAFEGISEVLLKNSITANNSHEFISAIDNFKDDSYDRKIWKKFVSENYPEKLFINKIKEILNN